MDSKASFTRQEIASQPEAWRQTLAGFASAWPADFLGVGAYEQLFFIGCGSTYYLSIWAARAAQVALGLNSRALPSSELMLAPDTWLDKSKKTLLVAVSRSGRTSETLEAVKLFKSKASGEVLAITCYPESELTAHSDYLVAVPAGQEHSVAQTRSFTDMMLAVNALIFGLPTNEQIQLIPASVQRLLERHAPLAAALGQDQRIERFFYLGSHALYGLACEAMLKLKEMSLSYSEAFHFMEFRHGPMSMVNAKSAVLGLLSNHATAYELAVLREMKQLGAQVIAVAPEGLVQDTTQLDHLIAFPTHWEGAWEHPLYLPVLQQLALERSLSNGLNPDQPENLTPVVVLS